MKQFSAITVVKEISRETFGQVRRTARINDKRSRPEKHSKRELSRRMDD